MANSKENTHVRIIPLEQEIDLRHIIHQAHVRWLRPPEIWEILRNYQKYDLKLSPVPPSKPPSGALFLFDRNVLRYFRKDGHNWRKKKDGKTVREAHERLKVGSVDVLHCYYAHGEDNPNFQRRSYWMLEGAYEHIVLVHYLEVTQSTRLGMYRMWNSAAEGALPAANHEEQSTSTVETFTPSLFPHALASSPGNSEPEVTGPSSFDPVDIANASYSSLLEEESGEDMQNKYVAGFIASIKQSSLLEQLSGRARIKDSATGLQRPAFVSSPEPGYGKEPNCELQPMKDFSGEKEQVSLSCPIQLSELKIDECNQKTAAYDIMQNLDNVDFLYPQRNPDLYLGPQLFSVSATSKNVKIDRDASENQGTGGTAQVDAMEHFVKKECCSPSWAELLEMCNRNASVDSLLNPNERVPQGSAAIESILQVPSSNRPPGTVLEAQLQAVTAENAIKAAAEARHQRGVSHMPLQSTHSSVPYAAQQVYAKQLLSTSQGGSSSRLADMQHHFESLDNRSELHQGQQQHRQQEQRENEIRNEASEWYDKKLWQQEELQNEANKFGLLGRDMQVVHAPSSTVRMQSNNEKVLLSEKQYPHLNKEDSLGRWWSEAISEDNESTPLTGPSDSGSEWVTTLDEEVSTKANSRGALQLQMDMGLNVSISRVQKFSIFEFSPDWGFAFEESKVLVNGKFLETGLDPLQCQWSCMFGELEVPAEIVNAGVLRCKAPTHAPGRVPFYVTCGERLSCSEIREFEYREKADLNSQGTTFSSEASSIDRRKEELLLQIRLAQMVFSNSEDPSISKAQKYSEHNNRSHLHDTNGREEWDSIEKLVDSASSTTELKEQLLQMLLKQKLQEWLLSKVNEGEKGACTLNGQGQGLLHLVAALDYGWAISPILAAGVGVNFRDVHGWTALHWAAAYGREEAVLGLLAAGAAAGPLIDPTPQYPDGRTPADLAAANRHGGIAAFLAEMSLTTHLKLLTIKDKSENEIYTISADWEGENAVQSVTDKGTIEAVEAGSEDQTSLKHSLRAVRNAAQTAASIRATFRQHSFRKREEASVGLLDEYGMTQLQIKNMVAILKLQKAFHGKKRDTAAIKIQRQFRGWKGRKEFLDLRQRVIKIQALVRGHQVRKHYKKILWSVGVLEKAVLRWRRKRVGLRNFHAFDNGSKMIQGENSDEDDDFLKAGRKQKELGVEKALTRVQSMVKSSKARAQYLRMLEGSQRTIRDPQDGESQLYDESFPGQHDDCLMSTEVGIF